jgi:serine/threonine-protein kinase
MVKCPTAEVLRHYLSDDGILGADQIVLIVTHVEACQSCQSKLEHLIPETGCSQEKDSVVEDPPRNEVISFIHKIKGALDFSVVGSDDTLASEVTKDPDGEIENNDDRLDCEPRVTSETRYQLIRPIASGGIGDVILAEDQNLPRQVAVKALRKQFAGHVDRIREFRNEVAITSRLSHPGVVPIYGVGEDSHGNKCYAMQLIQGESLQEAIDRLIKAGEAQGGSRTKQLDQRRLLTRFLAVCQTVAYAHSRGVIHRDLKPTNIMLSEFDETKVIDWGMAKLIGTPDSSSVNGLDCKSSQTILDSTTTDTDQLKGTPAFLCPEAVAGEGDGGSPTRDIYSLGVTLYVILTGKTPFRGSPSQILRKIREWKFQKPREVRKDVPRSLESICLKAMARRPADRYQTASALGRDIENWLADEPVWAHPERWPARLGRWLRKNPVATSSAAAGLIVALLGVGAVATLIDYHNRQLRAALARESKATESASNRFAMALTAMKAYEEGVRDDAVLKNEELKGLRDKLLRMALEFYGQLSNLLESEDDLSPDRQAALAEAEGRIGPLSGEVGWAQRSVEILRRAVTRLDRLIVLNPQIPRYRALLASMSYDLGLQMVATGNADEAEREYRRALDLDRDLWREHPEEPIYLSRQLLLHTALGRLLSSVRPKEAQGEFQRGVEIGETLLEKNPTVPSFRHAVTLCESNLARWLLDNGDRAAALELMGRNIEKLRKLADDFPAEARYRNDLAGALYGKAMALFLSYHAKDSKEPFSEAIALSEALVRENRAVIRYRESLARVYGGYGVMLKRGLRLPAEAERAYGRAVETYDALVREHPDNINLRRGLGNAIHNLAILLREAGRTDEALKRHTEAVKIFEALIEKSPDDLDSRRDLATSLVETGTDQMNLRRPEEARESYQRAIRHYRLAYDRAPKLRFVDEYLMVCYSNLAEVERALGRPVEAAKAALARQRLRPDRPGEYYTLARELNLCITLVGRGKSVLTPEGHKEREYYVELALSALRQAFAIKSFDVSPFRKSPDFSALLSRPDYQALLDDLAFPTDPFVSERVSAP